MNANRCVFGLVQIKQDLRWLRAGTRLVFKIAKCNTDWEKDVVVVV